MLYFPRIVLILFQSVLSLGGQLRPPLKTSPGQAQLQHGGAGTPSHPENLVVASVSKIFYRVSQKKLRTIFLATKIETLLESSRQNYQPNYVKRVKCV